MSTKKELLSLLRHKPLTVAELADELRLTRTAIATQLQKLVAENLVIKTKIRRSSSAGKPAQEYMLSPSAQDADSQAYIPFVKALIEKLSDDMDEKETIQLFESVGKLMASHAGLDPKYGADTAIESAIDFINELGAEAELVKEDGNLIIRNIASCPLASAVKQKACVCSTMAAFYSAATGMEATVACDRGKYLTCSHILTEKS